MFRKYLLNDGEPGEGVPSRDMAARLKAAMDGMRADFFEPGGGRIAYERIRDSETYRDFLKLSNSLKTMDLEVLARREERLAFWINLYNVIVIHGVVALSLKDSVKEVWNFFRRVYYRIGGHSFTPDDMEHGILRGNRRAPYALFRQFGGGDPRLRFIVEPLEPRLHFTLVCGASSCPFIDVYTPEHLEEELTLAGQTFINSGGAVLDRSRQTLSLSRIFKWYGRDFGADQTRRLQFIARYLDRKEDRDFILARAATLKLTYQKYDWRLNKG
ncbi:MAG: DUF547 domain-containing protein [Deltaproteobacteria bacterium]|nr:DUF547 domain-containing protein [Deltaproteobacteria bacterium]